MPIVHIQLMWAAILQIQKMIIKYNLTLVKPLHADCESATLILIGFIQFGKFQSNQPA